MIRLSIFLAAAIFLSSSYAQNSITNHLDDQTLSPSKPMPDQSNRRDNDNGTEIKARDPFSPIDYVPTVDQRKKIQEEQAAMAEKEKDRRLRLWNEAQSMLNVSGFSHMGSVGYFAIVNNNMVRVGDMVTVETSNGSFYWEITAIDEKGIRFKRTRAEIK